MHHACTWTHTWTLSGSSKDGELVEKAEALPGRCLHGCMYVLTGDDVPANLMRELDELQKMLEGKVGKRDDLPREVSHWNISRAQMFWARSVNIDAYICD